jgi:hypothetical protein
LRHGTMTVVFVARSGDALATVATNGTVTVATVARAPARCIECDGFAPPPSSAATLPAAYRFNRRTTVDGETLLPAPQSAPAPEH